MLKKNSYNTIVALLFVGATLLQTSCSPNSNEPTFTSASEGRQQSLASTLEQAKNKVVEGIFNASKKLEELDPDPFSEISEDQKKKLKDTLSTSYNALNKTYDILAQKGEVDGESPEARAFRAAFSLTSQVKVLADEFYEGLEIFSRWDLVSIITYVPIILEELKKFLQLATYIIGIDQVNKKKKEVEFLETKANALSTRFSMFGAASMAMKAQNDQPSIEPLLRKPDSYEY
ncbi:MAG: hypothetical protein AAFP00_01780 [Bacteroidota bacterium]